MTVDRSSIERELASVRAQQQQFVRLVEQTVGAEKALLGMLAMLDKAPSLDEAVKSAVEGMEVTDADDEPEPTAYDMGKVSRRAARRTTNGAPQ